MELKLMDLQAWIRSQLLIHLQPKTVVLLNGEMGAGKTEIVKQTCELLKYTQAQSPTFSIFNTYVGPQKMKIHHVDLYRLKGNEDLDSTGFWDLFESEEDLIFIEWAELVSKDQWPWGWKQIQIDIKKTHLDSRDIKLLLEPYSPS
jgi:tRNA threonylcarbamoyladenosine biosynthesis protein TsaE